MALGKELKKLKKTLPSARSGALGKGGITSSRLQTPQISSKARRRDAALALPLDLLLPSVRSPSPLSRSSGSTNVGSLRILLPYADPCSSPRLRCGPAVGPRALGWGGQEPCLPCRRGGAIAGWPAGQRRRPQAG